MDKLTLAKIIDPVIKPFLPDPQTASGGLGSLLAGGGLMQAMETIKSLQGLISQGNLSSYLVDHLDESVLPEIDRILAEAGYTKAG